MFCLKKQKPRKMNQVSTLDQLFDFEFKLLFYSGTYTDQKTTIFFLIRKIFVYIMSIIQLFSMFMQIFKVGDASQIIQVSYICVTHFSFCCKLVNFHLRQQELKEIRQFLVLKSFNEHPVEQRGLFAKRMNTFTLIATLYRWLLICCIIFLALSPIIDVDITFPLNSWYPFDVQKYWLQIYVSQIVAISLSAYNNSTIDLLTVRLLIVMAEQFDILNDNLKNLLCYNRDGGRGDVDWKRGDMDCKRGDMDCKREDMDSKKSKILRRHEDRLKTYIRHHYDILKFADLIETTFSNGIFIQFLASILVICMTGFLLLIIEPLSIRFALMIGYFFSMMIQVAIYCWNGDDVLISSENLRYGIYFSKWYESSLKMQKMLFIIMTRTKRPVVLTAGKFFTLSIDTLTLILRSAFSYFAVLKRLYANKI